MKNNQGFVLTKILPLILLIGVVIITAYVLGIQTGFFNRAAPLTSPQTGTTPSTWGQAVHLENDYFSNNFVAISRNNNIGVLNNNFTLEFWLKVTKFQSDFQSTLFHAGNDMNLFIDQETINGVNQSKLMLATGNQVANNYITGPNLNLNTWYHIAVSYQKVSTGSGTVTLGVNGNNISKSNMPLTDRTYSFGLGERLISGDIDEFRLSTTNRYPILASTYIVPTQPFINDGQTRLLYHLNNNLSDSSQYQNLAHFNNSLGRFVESTVTPPAQVTPTPTPPPTASYLSSFGAKAQNSKKVVVNWKLSNQLNIVGSNVLRSTKKANGQFGNLTKINPKLIPAKNPGSLIPATFKYTDTKVSAGKVYRYKVDVIGQNGKVVESSKLVKVNVPKK